MKTRNNQSHADETLLNQSITRRSFVKRSAVASAATVFGVRTLLGESDLDPNPAYTAQEVLGYTVVFDECSLVADVADETAAALKIADWALGNFEFGEMLTDFNPTSNLTMWDPSTYDTRTEEVYSFAPPNIPDAVVSWTTGASADATFSVAPNVLGGLTVRVFVPAGSITIETQTKGIRRKAE